MFKANPQSIHPGRRRRVFALAAALAVSAGLAAGAVSAATADAGPSRITTTTTPPTAGPTPAARTATTTSPGSANLTAADRLWTLAEHLAATPGDAHTGSYTYSHTQMWARATAKVARIDTQTWRHANGSGVIVTRTLPERANLLHLPDGKDRKQFSTAHPITDTYKVGQLAPAAREPITTDPSELAEQLYLNQPRENGPISLLRGLLDLTAVHYLDRGTRATALRLLATIPTLRYDGPCTDIAGRAAIAVSLDTGGSRDQLLIDPATGEFLAHQETLSTSPPALFAYHLYLARDRRASAGQA